MSNIIFIKNLQILGVHGATAIQNKKPRIFNIDIEVYVNEISKAIETDNIVDVFDYRYAIKASRKFIEGKSVHLIETLANNISSEILKHPKVEKIKITLRKREFGDKFDSGITLVRSA